MSTDVSLGIKCKCYVNVGTYGTPTWDEVNLISDLNVNSSWDEGESSARISLVKTAEPTMMALELSGKIRVNYSDPAYRTIHEAFIAADKLDVMVLNGDKGNNGVTGYRFDAKTFAWSEDQSQGAVLYKAFTMKPCASSNVPKAVAVAGGVPVFTGIGGGTATSFL